VALDFWLLDELKVEEALLLLRQAAEIGDLRGPMAAWRFRWREDVFGASATVGIPFDQQMETVLEPIFETYTQWAGRQPKVGSILPEMEAIADKLTHLLCHYQSSANQEQVREYLLIVTSSEPKILNNVFEQLRFHATHVRAAAANLADQTLHVFHILDDVQRKSDFQSLLASDALQSHTLLSGWETPRGAVFLPPGAIPGEGIVHSVAELIAVIPELFGGRTTTSAPEGCLLACYATPQQLRMLRLDGLRFADQARFASPSQAPKRVEVALLQQSDSAVLALEQTLSRSVPHVAYRLSLRRLALPERVQSERERLMARKAELEYQLAFIRGLDVSRPRLLRFNQLGLRALAAWLREIPHDTLQAGSIRYAFHGTQKDPAGHHYLWTDPNDTILENLDPLPLYQDGQAVQEFWLDPLWSRDYLEQAHSLVFTPKGAALFPTMHAWDHDAMDDYLRTVVSGWYPDLDLPEAAVYIFEVDEDKASEQGLLLTVLDRQRFEPLHTRLRWLNDNLALAESENSEAWIRAMADQITRGSMAKRLRAWAEKAEETFTQTARQANQNIASKLADLERVFDRELQQVSAKTATTADILEELHEGLDALLSVRKNMDKVSGTALREMTQTRNEATRLTRELGMLERKMQMAMTQREKLSEDVEKEVLALREAHDRIKQSFYRIMQRSDK
jgi:hypothetical protein